MNHQPKAPKIRVTIPLIVGGTAQAPILRSTSNKMRSKCNIANSQKRTPATRRPIICRVMGGMGGMGGLSVLFGKSGL
jgi:hypothetical protein